MEGWGALDDAATFSLQTPASQECRSSSTGLRIVMIKSRSRRIGTDERWLNSVCPYLTLVAQCKLTEAPVWI